MLITTEYLFFNNTIVFQCFMIQKAYLSKTITLQIMFNLCSDIETKSFATLMRSVTLFIAIGVVLKLCLYCLLFTLGNTRVSG